MADSLKKIGAMITLDGEKEYKAALQSIKQEQSVLRSEMKLSQTTFKDNADSVEALTEKGEILEKQCETQKEKVALLTGALESAKKEYGENSDKVADWQIQLNNAKTDLLKMENAVNSNNDALDEAKAALDSAGTEAQDTGDAISELSQALDKAESALNNTGGEAENTGNAVDELAQALDKTGGEAGGAETEISQLASELDNAEKKSHAFAVAAGTLAANAIEFLGSKAKDAAKYVIDVGSKFESSMSNVAAISGASQKDLDRMSKKAKELGSSTKFSASEAADAFGYMALAGWDTQAMLNGIDGVMQLAAASGMDLAESSDMVTDYLSAFGMEAKDSAYFADLLAAAQTKSNTTAAQLGEAYKNCAANLNAAGQDVETVTALLEAMANQGLKGSEAGTALNAIMRDITSGMEDGAIAIGETNIAVMDSQGNFRDLTDILTDVEVATNGMGDAERAAALQTTFTSDSTKGLNLILNEGVGACAEYEEALRNSGGTAQATADIMQSNLFGKITEMDSALEGLGIATFEYISGPAQGIVEGITGAIATLTEWITPTSDAWTTFMSGIELANDELEKTIYNANATIDSATVDTNGLEAYKNKLLELNEVEGKSEWQKQQIKYIVEELSGQIPELAEAYDSETGSINLTNQEIENLISNQEQLVMQNAAMEVREELYRALFDAEINAAKAGSAVEEAERKFHEVAGENIDTLDEYIIAWGLSSDAVQAAEIDLNATREEQERANKAIENAKTALEETDAILTEMGYPEATEETEDLTEAQEELQEETERMAEDTDALSAALVSYAEKTKESISEVEEQFDSMAQKYADTYNSAYDSIMGQLDLYNQWSGGTEIAAADILSNLASQAQGMQNYAENLNKLFNDDLAENLDAGFIQYLKDMGPEAANLVAELVKEIQGGNQQLVLDLNENWEKYYNVADTLATENAEAESNFLAFADSLGLDADTLAQVLEEKGIELGDNYTASVSSGLQNGKPNITEDLSAIQQEAEEKIEEYAGSGSESASSYISEMSSGISGAVFKIGGSLALITAELFLFDLVMKGYGSSTSQGYMDNFNAKFEDGILEISQKLDQVKNAANSLSAPLMASGIYAADGLVNGFIARVSQRYQEVAAAAARIQAVVNSALQIRSPSKLLWESGEFTGEGLTGGTIEAIKEGLPEIEKTALALGDTISDAINPKDIVLPEINMPDMTLRQEVQQESYNAGRQGDSLSQVIGYLQTIAKNSQKGIYLDNGVLVGQLGEEIDNNLSDLSDLRRRGM